MNSTAPLVKFAAEIKQVSSKKLASMDVEYRVVLSTADPAIMALGIIDGDVLVDVTVEKQV